MSERTRAAVVLFVDSESGTDEVDLAFLVKAALHQGCAFKNGLTATIMGSERSVRVVDVMGVGMAIGNGYLWTKPTSKSWSQRGIVE